MRRASIAVTVVALGALLCQVGCLTPGPAPGPRASGQARGPKPPVAPRDASVHELHGDRRVDDYDWLRNRDAPQVRSYLEAENDYTRTMMRSTAKMQRTLVDEFQAREQHGDAVPSVRRGDYEYYARTQEGKAHALYCRRRALAGAAEEVLLDLNRIAENASYVDLGSFEVSDDGGFLAYTLDTQGLRDYTLYVKDLRGGTLGSERIRQVAAVAWASEHTLFYAVEDADKRPYRVYRHSLGEPSDALVREESDPRFSLAVSRSRSKSLVFIVATGESATEVAFIPARQPKLAPQTIAKRREHHEYYVDQRGAWFFIRTNDRSRNFRLVVVQVASPAELNWRELMAPGAAVTLEELAVFQDYLVVHEREGGLPYLRVGELRTQVAAAVQAPAARLQNRNRNKRPATAPSGPTGPQAPQIDASYRVAMPEPVYELHAEENPNFGAQAYRFSYESLTSPLTYYEYRIRSRELDLIKRGGALAGYDPEQYREERLLARAADGTQIPISLVYRADKSAGPSPMLLEAFGAYGYPFPTTFSSTRVSLLDRGFVYAIAHVRGGGELGPRWHDAGRLRNKRNSFEDFIAVAEHLIGHGLTAPDRLAIEGASAGGLLVATVINERPELFQAALLDVPFVDMLNSMSDPDLPLPASEYEEWGNPALADDYRYMKSYCPYTNIAHKDYPTLLVKTSYDDSEVMYWEPAKYVAKLRAKAVGRRPVLLWVNLASDPGESSAAPGDALRERAFDYAFLLSQVGRADAMRRAAPANADGTRGSPQAPTIPSAKITKLSH